MPVQSVTVRALMRTISAASSTQGIDDVLTSSCCNFYKFLREKKWSWNWAERQTVTVTPIKEPVTTLWSWDSGTDVVHTTIVCTLDSADVTGCYVKLGNEFYKIIDYNYSSSIAFRVNRPISSKGTDVVLVFVRLEYCFRGGAIRRVEVGGSKLVGESPNAASEVFDQFMVQTYRPYAYTTVDRDDALPPSPIEAPYIVAPGAGAFPAGRYIYFYTRYDPVSKAESLPGPVTEYRSDGAHEYPIVRYGSFNDWSDFTSYNLRLYRTQVNPRQSDSPPFFFLNERGPRRPTTPFTDGNVVTLRSPQYYDGRQTIVRIGSYDEIKSFKVQLVDTYGGRFWEEENVSIGEGNAIIDALSTYAAKLKSGAANDPAKWLEIERQLRGQIDYLLTIDNTASAADYNTRNYIPRVPGLRSSQPLASTEESDPLLALIGIVPNGIKR